MLENKKALPATTVQYRKNEITIFASQHAEEGEDFPLEVPLTPVEGTILDLALSLFRTGKETFTAIDLLALGAGKTHLSSSRVYYSQVLEVEKAIFYLRSICIALVSKKADMNQAGQILPVYGCGIDECRFRDKNSEKLRRWQFVEGEPVLLSISQNLFRGALDYPGELLAIGRTRGLESVSLKKYLLDRVYYCNAQKGRYRKRPQARKILFRSICQHQGAATPRQKRLLQERVFYLLDQYAKSGICPLVSFEVSEAPGRNGLAFSLVFQKDGNASAKKFKVAPGQKKKSVEKETLAKEARNKLEIAQKERGCGVED